MSLVETHLAPDLTQPPPSSLPPSPPTPPLPSLPPVASLTTAVIPPPAPTPTVDAASHVSVVASPPPDAASIPIHPPHGTPPPPIGELLPEVIAAEELSAPPTAVPSVFTPPPATPTPPTEPEQELRTLPADLSIATPQPDMDLTLAHGPLGAEPGFGNPEDDIAMVDCLSSGTSVAPISTPAAFTGTGGYLEVVSPEINGHGMSSPPSFTHSFHYDHGDAGDQPPPAKRQKLDGDSPNLTIDATMTDTFIPAAPVSSEPGPMAPNQTKYALSIIRNLRKHKDSIPFQYPVDHVALNIPHYPTIVTNPMDLHTMEKKLGSGPKDGQALPRYQSVQEFTDDMRLIFKNCYLFNGPEHPVTHMGQRLEEAFDKLLKNMPPPEEVKPVPKPPKKPLVARRQSTANANARDTYASNRPKREIPPPKEFALEHKPAKPRKRAPRNDGTIEQLKFCTKLINELYKKQYSAIAYPFYEPVDIVKLDIPHYPKIVKKPMDMSTMLDKLTRGVYTDPKQFHADFKLMIKNCLLFNPQGTPVNQAGVELNEVFDQKWAALPPLKGEETEQEEEEEESDIDPDVDALQTMEAQIANLHSALFQLRKKKDKKMKKSHSSSSITAPPKPPKAPKAVGSSTYAPPVKKKRKNHDEDDSLTFEQKKQLSEGIQTLDGGRLEKVLEIIDEVYPEIRESSEEIELDIDSLPSHVLNRLYNFVIRPNKPRLGRPPNGAGPSHSGHSKNSLAGTKRKSMDEEAESEKIRQLEATLERLRNGTSTQADQDVAAGVNGDDDSGSDSDSDSSSGSDSE